MNKFFLFTLILIASCFGILGMVEKSEAAGVDVEVHFLKVGTGEVSSAEVGDEIIIQVIASAVHSPIMNKPFEIDINGSPYKCSSIIGSNCKFGVAGGNIKCACEALYSFPSEGNYKVTGTAYSSSGESYSGSKTITIGNVPAQLLLSGTGAGAGAGIGMGLSSTSSNSGSMVNLPTKKLSKILEDLIKWLLKIVILIAVLMIIVSGAMYMISAGDQQKADTAKKALTYAILGLLVVVLAYAIVNTLVDILS